MLALLGRKAGEAWCCSMVLASYSIFFLFLYTLHTSAVERERGAGGTGEQDGCSLLPTVE